tara:strand:+ start:1783 stop:3534 length:1752 start_codon:yes stop_codon:yes gene_type:complete
MMIDSQDTTGQNLFAIDVNAQSRLREVDPEEFSAREHLLSSFGQWVGETVDNAARYTDLYARPMLRSYDRDGGQIAEITHNYAWNSVNCEVYKYGVVGLNYGKQAAPFTTTFFMGYLLSQADVSLHCPVTMTGAVAYVLDQFAPEAIRARYLPELIRTDGHALSGGTWVTEIHGGSDVGATSTMARSDNEGFRLTGLKWFASNPLGGLALATARPDPTTLGVRGLGLYLVPVTLPDGTPNPMRLRRLKDKLGTCGLATAEVELTDTWALEVMPPPRGLRVMMEALGFSRIHNAMAAVGLSRRAFLEAISYLSRRKAFGEQVTQFPMVQQELIKLLVRQEADFELSLASAVAFDAFHSSLRASVEDKLDHSSHPQVWLRMLTALAKYQTAENANRTCRAVIELIGGNAYTSDYVTPRLLRDAQVTTVWEGPANIQALELLRILDQPYNAFQLFDQHIEKVCAATPHALEDASNVILLAKAECKDAVTLMTRNNESAQHHARTLLALMAETLAAAFLLQNATLHLAAGDARKAIVTRLYIEESLKRPARRGIVEGGYWGCRYFNELVGYKLIPDTVEKSWPCLAE